MVTHPRKLRQAAAVCFRYRASRIEFLLVRTSGGRWTFPKGKIDPGFTPSEAAAREAMEEAGALGKTRSNHLTRYLHQRRGRTHAIEAYLLHVAQTASPREPLRNPTWFLPTEAKLRLSEGRGRHSAAELCRVVDHAVDHLRSRM